MKGAEEINDEAMIEKEEEDFHELEVLSAKNEICTRFITCLPPILNSESSNFFHKYRIVASRNTCYYSENQVLVGC